MITKTYVTALAFLFAGVSGAGGQVFSEPAVGLKSHQTMEIDKVEITQQKTIIYISLVNRITGGTFCADRNIYIILPDGTRLGITKASGIPRCPDVHRFKKPGEILGFSLEFPALPHGTGWIDLIENCNDVCFTVYGILLNDGFSRRIDEAVSYVEKGQTDTAIGLYQKLIQDAGYSELGITGSLYSDLVSLLQSKGYTASAADWYRKLAASDFPWKELYINNLNFHGIKY